MRNSEINFNGMHPRHDTEMRNKINLLHDDLMNAVDLKRKYESLEKLFIKMANEGATVSEIKRLTEDNKNEWPQDVVKRTHDMLDTFKKNLKGEQGDLILAPERKKTFLDEGEVTELSDKDIEIIEE